MKPILFLTVIIVAAMACNNSTIKTQEVVEIETIKDTLIQNSKKACFEYVNNRDTVSMQLIIRNNNVEGTLAYKYFEKDKSTGTLKGKIIEDTLMAEYSFMAEGTNSIREVVFVREDAGWKEGYGDMEERNSKMLFKTPRKLDFSNSVVLSRVNCK